MSLLITLQGRHSSENRGPGASLAVSMKIYKMKIWRLFFEKEDMTTAFSLFMRLSPCNISRFGVSLPQSNAPFTATSEIAYGLVRRFSWIGDWIGLGPVAAESWGLVSHWLWPVFKNEKESIEKELKGWDCSSVFEHLSRIHESLGSVPIITRKERDKEKEAFLKL